MNKVIEILMNRDDVTEEEARAIVSNAQKDILQAIEDQRYDTVEDIMYSQLSLEMDYIDDVLYF